MNEINEEAVMRLPKQLMLLAALVSAPLVATAQSADPNLDTCLEQPSVVSVQVVKGGGSANTTVKLDEIGHSHAVIEIEACGSGGGGQTFGPNEGEAMREGNGGQRGARGGAGAPLQRIIVRCGDDPLPFDGDTQALDCSRTLSIKVPGASPSNQSGSPVKLIAAAQNPSDKDLTWDVALGAKSGAARFGAQSLYAGGEGGRRTNDLSIEAQPGTSSLRFPGGKAWRDQAGGGSASDIGEGGAGGGGEGGRSAPGDGGLCAGGGGGVPRFAPNGGKGGPGYAKITIINLKEAAGCGMKELTDNLGPYIEKQVRQALKSGAK